MAPQRGDEGELVGDEGPRGAGSCVYVNQILRYALRGARIELSFDDVYASPWPRGPMEGALCGGETRALSLGPADGERLSVGGEAWFTSRSACEAALGRGERLRFPGFPCLAAVVADPAALDQALAGRLPQIDAEKLRRYQDRLEKGGSLYWLHGENVDPECVEAKSIVATTQLEASWTGRGAVRTYRYFYTFDPGCPRLRDVHGDLVLPPGAPIVGVGGKEPLTILFDEALPGNTDRLDALFLTRAACEDVRKRARTAAATSGEPGL